MTKEAKAMILIDEWEQKKIALDKEYEKRYYEAMTTEEVLEVNHWHTEETNKIEQWFIQSFLYLAKE